ncbi:MAG: ATP synthase F1 subunit gamma [Candidatus Schekmanbacteria bacterium]|nr:MAG: ATP synthase F1 subunit gamma [Candidatus Schekmanbacteria bacterium]
MPSVRDIKRRIASVKKTEQITKAMKMVSAAKFRRAQERIIAARPYGRKINDVLKSLAFRAGADAHPLLSKGEEGVIEIVVISGDKGLCGAFNNNVFKETDRIIRSNQNKEINLTLIGKKCCDYYRKRNWNIRNTYSDIFNNIGYEHAVRITREITKNYIDEEIEKVIMVYNEFKSAVSQQVVCKQLLPIEITEDIADENPVDFIYEPDRQSIINELLPRSMEVIIYTALLDSVAAEHAARMSAMENASRNASEMIDSLTLKYNKARQAAITKELLEIVAGAEALSG